MKPNMYCVLVHWKTGDVIETQYFYDSSLSWQQLRDGRWYIHSMYSDHGKPTDEWLQNNPRPVR